METKKIDSTVKPVFKSDEEQLETEYDERVADLETDHENNRNTESQDAEDLQEPRRSNRTRKPPERDSFITGDWWKFEESLNADTYENTEEPTTIQEALNSSAKVKWKEPLIVNTHHFSRTELGILLNSQRDVSQLDVVGSS